MTAVSANGITIEFEEQGEGEPLLLVMGLGGQLIDWPQEFVDLLSARGFRVIRLDNRDAGLSTEFTDVEPPTSWELVKSMAFRRPMRSAYVLGDMAADAVGLLDALGIERAHVVGASMGGMIAQQMAIDHPGRVLTMTSIMSTTGSPKVGRPKMKVLRRAMRRDASRRQGMSREEAIDTAVEFFRLISGPRFDAARFRTMAEAAIDRSFRPLGTSRQFAAIAASGDRTDALGRVTAPTLVVHGMVDPLVGPTGGIATAKAVPGSRLLMFNDMGHDLPRHRWPEIVEAIADHARRAAA